MRADLDCRVGSVSGNLSRMLFASVVIVLFSGCNTTTLTQLLDRDTVYQTVPLAYLESGENDAGISVTQFASIGNFGIGTFSRFDGEALLLDGTPYRITDGKVTTPDPAARILLSACTLFDEGERLVMRHVPSFKHFSEALEHHFSTNRLIYAIRVEGEFENIRLSCCKSQDRDKSRTETAQDVNPISYPQLRGTLVGFWIPPHFSSVVSTNGFHLDFISADKTLGGKVVDFRSEKLMIILDQTPRMTLQLSTVDDRHIPSIP